MVKGGGSVQSWDALMQMMNSGDTAKIGKQDWAKMIDQYVGTTYACIRKIATGVASTPLMLYTTDQNQSDSTRAIEKSEQKYLTGLDYVNRFMKKKSVLDLVEVTDHPIITLLSHINSRMTRYNFLDLLTVFLELTGNCYILTGEGQPENLRFLYPQFMKINQNKKTGDIKEYIYKPGQDEIKYKPEEIIQFWYPGPFSQIYGYSPVVAASYPISIEQSTMKFQNSSFESMGMPPALIKMKNRLTPKEFDSLKKQIDVAWGSVTTPMLLEGEDISVELLATSPKEMGFVEGEKLARELIANQLGIPISKLTMESSNRAVADVGERDFMRDTIKPKCIMIGEELTENLTPRYPDDDLVLAFADPVEADRKERILERKTNLSAGYSLINEERAIDGKEPVEGGDELRVPANMIPISQQNQTQQTIEDTISAVTMRVYKQLKKYGIKQ